MVNILSGGLHAGRGMDVQDFLAVPVSAISVLEAIQLTSRVRAAATRLCAERGLPTLLADEGGLSPGCRTGQEALELLTRSIETAGLTPGIDISIAIDVAATSLYDRAAGDYRLRRQERHLSTTGMIDMVSTWIDTFPIVSIEDPLDEEDWGGWQTLTARIGRRVRLVGDDLFTTNSRRLAEGIARGAANGVLVKVNQNGTLTGTLDVVAQARAAGYAPVVSARSGETEDDFRPTWPWAPAPGRSRSVPCATPSGWLVQPAWSASPKTPPGLQRAAHAGHSDAGPGDHRLPRRPGLLRRTGCANGNRSARPPDRRGVLGPVEGRPARPHPVRQGCAPPAHGREAMARPDVPEPGRVPVAAVRRRRRPRAGAAGSGPGRAGRPVRHAVPAPAGPPGVEVAAAGRKGAPAGRGRGR